MKSLAVAAVVLAGATMAAQEPVYKAKDPGVSNPIVAAEKKPSYTSAAMRRKIQGVVHMTAVIDRDGKPTDITVVKSLDNQYGLDDNAVAALKEWRFKPAMKDGKPVLFHVTIEMSFTLRDDRVYSRTDPAVKAPVVLTEKRPVYTAEAARAKIEGVVTIEGIIGIDGKLREMRVVKGLDSGLDANALAAAEQWTFTPGSLNGRPVPYRVTIELTFTLRD